MTANAKVRGALEPLLLVTRWRCLRSHGRGHGLALVLARNTVSAAHRCNRTMTCRSALDTDAAYGRQPLLYSAPSLLESSWWPAVPQIRPLPPRQVQPGRLPLARADDHGQRPWGRAWHLRGELPYGQGGYGLGQAQLPGDRLGRSTGGVLGDAAGDRQGRHAGGRRHRRGHQGSAAGYLGAIGGRLHAVRSPAAAGLASSLAGPSLVRGTRRNNGQPRIITDTDRAAQGP
jgi:hypothetical protein